MAFIALIAQIYANVKQYGATGNGTTDDAASIQSAINAVATSGGTVFFPPGTYVLSVDLTVPSNVSILGAGRSSILLAQTNSQTNCLNLSGSAHITVSNLAINGNKLNVQQLATQYTKLNGIYMAAGTDDVTIRDCYIHDCYVSGIMADGGCTNLQISNNRMLNNIDNQIYIRAKDTTPYTVCQYGTITGNVCSGGGFSGIQVLGSSYFTITGNTCYSNGPTSAQGDGIGSEGASHITITGNECYSNGIQGINVRFTSETGGSQSSNHVVVSGNECYNHTSTNGDAGGISVSDTNDIEVSGNLIYNNAYGIHINGGNGNGVTNCKLVGNAVRSNSNIGIYINPGNSSDFSVEDCDSTDNAGDNLYATTRVMVQGGTYARAASSHEGIHLASGANNSVVQGAFIYDNLDNGILIDSPVAGALIRNCYFDGAIVQNQTRAIQEQAGAGPTLVVGCFIRNQNTNLYTFNNTGSRFYNEQTVGTVVVTTSYTMLAYDDVVLCNQSGAIAITLPAATGGVIGKVITVKDKAGNANTNNITISGAQNIDGAASKVINTAYGVLRIISDGANWFTV
jgi:parallel beta-helix repeat protein